MCFEILVHDVIPKATATGYQEVQGGSGCHTPVSATQDQAAEGTVSQDGPQHGDRRGGCFTRGSEEAEGWG